MELLAQESLSEEDSDQAFVVGIFSLLGSMLDLPQDVAMSLIPVPDAVSAAVLRHEGVLGELLILAQACEASDDAAFHRSAGALRLSSQQINWAHLQALAWTDQLADSSL